MADTISFFLNGEPVTLDNPSPDLLLIDYHRSAPAHLAHAMSFSRAAAPPTFVTPVEIEAVQAAVQARSAASAAASAAAVDAPLGGNGSAPAAAAPAGVEAAGVEAAGMNSGAYRLAMNNGTQCGYCSAGFVMNMCGLLKNRPEPTKREIQDVFDGNLCRCTGYRPILTGMETFAKDWTAADEQRRMKCLGEDALSAIVPAADLKIPLPPAIGSPRAPHVWTPTTRSGSVRRHSPS